MVVKDMDQVSIPLDDRVIKSIACPTCRFPLALNTPSIVCSQCGITYDATQDGIPILFGRDSEFFERRHEVLEMARNYAGMSKEQTTSRKVLPLSKRLLPRTTPYQLGGKYFKRAIETTAAGFMVNLGAGKRDRHPDVPWVNLDIAPRPHVDIVADAHQLPFLDETVSAIVSTNVFEYLRNPFEAASEIARVLSPDGMLFINVAFILPLSTPDYHDRFRFTPGGLQSLFCDMEILQIGPSSGPIRALARLWDRVIDVVIGNKYLAFPVRFVSGWLMQPFKYLDPLILKHDDAGLSASGFFLLARKRS